MTNFSFSFGVLVVLIALFVFVFLTLAPPRVRVPAARRTAEESDQAGRLSKLSVVGQRQAGRLLRTPAFTRVSALDLEQSGISMPLTSFVAIVMYAVLAFAFIGAALADFSGWAVLSAVFFAVLPILGARFFIRSRAERRRARFGDQLDETLGLVAGALRAGHGLVRALDAASQESESPTKEEMARILVQNRMGLDLGDSLIKLSERMQNQDFLWVAQAITINREVGGNLAEVLDGVGKTIRERNQIRRQVKSLSAEGRLSAYVLMGLPIGVFAYLFIVQPRYFDAFFTNVFGIMALIGALILLIIGSIWMSKVVKVTF